MLDAVNSDVASLNLMSEENLARRIQYEMDKRGWSQERMAKEMTDAGHPLHQSSVSKIVRPKEGKRRAISVDDALGFAKVFGMTLDEMLIPIEAVTTAEVRELMLDIAKINTRRKELDAEADEKLLRVVRLALSDYERGLDLLTDSMTEVGLNEFLWSQTEEFVAWKDRTVARLKWLGENVPECAEGIPPEWRDFVLGIGPKPDEKS